MGLPRIGREITQQAIELVAREHAFHPVQDYLNGPRWDGTNGMDTWLRDHVGANSQEPAHLASICRWFLISMVARIFAPGCKCDYMLVFEGEQGIMKPTVCAILAGEWFSDNLPKLCGGDRCGSARISAAMADRGRRVVVVRQGRSRCAEVLHHPPGRALHAQVRHNEVIEPRQCVFVGTTNKPAWLRDETGGRRFWPVKAGTIHIEGLKAARDQLFAEAVVAFRAGERYWPDQAFEDAYIKPEQEQRFVADSWETVIGKWLETPAKDPKTNKPACRERCTVPEVAEQRLKIEAGRLGTADQRRITSALGRLGWGQKRDMKGRWWRRMTAITAYDGISL